MSGNGSGKTDENTEAVDLVELQALEALFVWVDLRTKTRLAHDEFLAARTKLAETGRRKLPISLEYNPLVLAEWRARAKRLRSKLLSV